ncbi:MAG: hypothetical protein IKK74_04595 [Clostridia bacterium]|nr:hypothetical protein [Clostridia bacterium]
MTRLRFAAFVLAFLLILSACGEDLPDEPAVSASVGEHTSPETTAPDSADTTDETTEPEETEPEVTLPADITQLKASEILALTVQLCGLYNNFTRNSKTRTEIEIDGELTEKVTESAVTVKDKNAVFRRNGEEYHLVDSFLCFGGALGKYRVGGMSVISFLEMFSDQLPLGSFEEGVAEHGGGEIVLKFDKLSDSGVAYLRKMLGLTDAAVLEVAQSSLEVYADSNGNMRQTSTELSLTVSLSGEELMRVEISSEMRQNTIVGIVELESPSIADYILFPDLETIAYCENAAAQIEKFKSNREAFEFTDTRSTKIEAKDFTFNQNSTADYAYASRIGLSIDSVFDTADGVKHSLLTHYNNRRAFSQIDGESIFVDTTINKKNLFFMTFRPIDTAFYRLTDCRSAEIVKEGRIELTLKDSVIKALAQQILLTSGIPCEELTITKINRAVTYIELDSEGRLSSVGYELSLNLTVNGKAYTLAQTADVTVTSHNSAKVKVIFIDVPDDEE